MNIYKAVKNWLHNTQRVDRAQLRELVKECVGDIVRDEVRRYMQTNAFEAKLTSAILAGGWAAPLGTPGWPAHHHPPFAEEIKRMVADRLAARFDLSMKPGS